MNRRARRRRIERIVATAGRLTARMGGAFVINRRKLRDYVRHLADQPAQVQPVEGEGSR